MNRYLSSLIIALFIYSTVVISAVTFLYVEDDSTALAKQESRVSISLMAQKEILPKKEPVPIKKPEPKPIIEKEPVKEPIEDIKPLIEPEPVPVPETEPVVEELDVDEIETAAEDTTKQEAQKEVAQESISAQSTATDALEVNMARENELKAKRDQFLTALVEQINKNKSYPNIARRRAVQGEVQVQFEILSNGNVRDVEIISGRKVFKRSALSAIEESFPMDVDTELFEFPKEFSIKISYVLH